LRQSEGTYLELLYAKRERGEKRFKAVMILPMGVGGEGNSGPSEENTFLQSRHWEGGKNTASFTVGMKERTACRRKRGKMVSGSDLSPKRREEIGHRFALGEEGKKNVKTTSSFLRKRIREGRSVS